jgi:EAL domain-containing protein (putative c-di-GMP-specific phosphodiesterase class I)
VTGEDNRQPPRRADRPSRPPGSDDSALMRAAGPSSLDTPRRLVDISTGLPALTSLFNDLWPIVEDPDGTTVVYIHIPSSSIVEERFGWEALETYRGLIANYLVSFAQETRRDRGHCVLARTYADDFVVLAPRREDDVELPTRLADGMTRHLSAIDEETAVLLQVYVGMAQTKPFPKIHPERRLYRAIQQAQTEATDVSRQQLSAKVRILDRCINQQQFVMVYQPLVEVADHNIHAYEALVRCQVKELKSPHILFNVAEQGDRMWPLSRLLRRIAISEVPQLPGGTLMFLNAHPMDFDDPDLFEPDGPLALHAAHSVLEVTERAAIHDLNHFRDQLKRLRDLGLRIAVDDLGSGYSSLSLVAELDPDYVKLDMTLIRDIDKNPVRQNLVRNIVSFAGDLKAWVVAEGVETRDELDTVRELGCQLVQGYYLAMPSPPFVKAIEARPS